MRFTLNLASKPGVPNANKVVYSQEAFDKMLNSNWTKELLEQKSLYVLSGPSVQNIDYTKPINLMDCVGKVLEWDGPTAEVDIYSTTYGLIVEELKDELELGMNYTCRLTKGHDGNTEAVGMRIHSFSLIDKRTHRYV